MRIKHFYFHTIIFSALMLFGFSEVRASHAMGADLQYICLGNNQYRIILRFYRDCGGIPAPGSAFITISAPGCGTTFSTTLNMNTSVNCPPGTTQGCEVSQLCPSQISQSECNFSPPSPFHLLQSSICILPKPFGEDVGLQVWGNWRRCL